MTTEGQICSSTKKVRGVASKTQDLRQAILDTFGETDKPVTVRQMFYMLTVAGAVPKSEKQGYRPVQRQLVLMRRARLIPYSWVADNTRWMRKPRTYKGLADFLTYSARHFRQAVWEQTDCYVEIWIEKDALAGVVLPVTSLYDVPLMVARGYSSESFVYEAAAHIRDLGKPAYIYYLGDFDPSGWDMSRGLEIKLREFGADIQFERLAVNPSQIEVWQLPARPSKETDTRCKRFYDEFGQDQESVELDAIHPNQLRMLVQEAIEQHLDADYLERIEQEEQSARAVLDEIVINLNL